MSLSERLKALVAVVIVLLFVSTGSAQIVQNVQVGRSWPRAIVIDPTNNIIYVNTISGEYPLLGFTLTEINGSDNSVLRTIPFNGVPEEMAIDAGRATIYAVSSKSILVFDVGSSSFVRSFDLGSGLYGIAVDPVTNRVYATSEDTLYALDASNGTIVATTPMAGYAQGVAVNAATNRVYVAEYLSGEITVVDGATMSPLAQVKLPLSSPSQLVVDEKTDTVYATTGRNFVVALDGSTNAVKGEYTVAASDQNGTFALVLDESANRVFVAIEPGLVVKEIDGGTGAVVQTFPLNYTAYELAINQFTGKLYVTNYHQVTVIETTHDNPSDALLAVGVASILTIALVGFALRRRRSVTATGGKPGGPP